MSNSDLQHADESHRMLHLQQIADECDQETLKSIEAIIIDPLRSHTERLAGVAAVLRLKNQIGQEFVQSLSQHDQAEIRVLMAEALGETSRAGIPQLFQYLLDDVNTVRNIAERSLMSLIALFDDDLIHELVEILKHPVPLIRSPAARLLGLTKSTKALQPLIDVLQHDKQWLARLWAAKGLGDLGDQQAMPHLVEHLLHDEKDRVRSCCAEAIGKLKHPEAGHYLRLALEDPNGGVVKIASEQLQAMGYEMDLEQEDPFDIPDQEE